MKSNTQNEIKFGLDILGFKLKDLFYTIFISVIPGNRSKFTNFEFIENSMHIGQIHCYIYYTHSYASYEKPHIENNHALLR